MHFINKLNYNNIKTKIYETLPILLFAYFFLEGNCHYNLHRLTHRLMDFIYHACVKEITKYQCLNSITY